MGSIKFNYFLFAIGCFICSLLAFVISLYYKPFDFVILNAAFLFLSAGIYILSLYRRNFGEKNTPLVKSKVIIYMLLPTLILCDGLLFYTYIFINPISIFNWRVIDKDIFGQFALMILCWIGIIFNLKYYKKNI